MEILQKSIATAYAQIARTEYQTIAGSRSHSIVVDEPERLKGGDTGMTPFELLLSSLGSCTVITLRMYVDRKMWIVDEIKTELEMFPVQGGHLIKRYLTFKGNLTPEQIHRLVEIADQCPVHKILTGDMMIETSVV